MPSRGSTAPLWAQLPAFGELEPMLRRAVSLNPVGNVRLRLAEGVVTALIWLPFDVLVGRSIAIGIDHELSIAESSADSTVRTADLLAWLGSTADFPQSRDGDWRGSVPPRRGWHRIDRVPAPVVRSLVTSGARAITDAAEREGISLSAGGQPRAEVTDALLSSTVLTVSDQRRSVAVSLRLISAITRMGFLPADSFVSVDVCRRWTRVAAPFGSAYAEIAGLGLSIAT